MKTCNTTQAARAAGVSRATLQSWISSGRIEAPELQIVGGKAVRLWKRGDIAKLKRFKGTLRPGPKEKKTRS